MYFDVKHFPNCGTKPQFTLTTAIASAEEAIEIFSLQYGKSGYHPHVDDATLLKHVWDTRDKEYWYKKWRDAIAAMPVRRRVEKYREWVSCEKGTVPVPDFIKGRAKGKMRIEDGRVQRLTTFQGATIEFGRVSALACILGYVTWTDAGHKRPTPNVCALMGRKIPEMSRPRDAKTRKLLSQLGVMDPLQISILLVKARKKMKRYCGRSRYAKR
jgi:hypothetical protein